MSKQLPSRPHLRNLQNQAKRLLKGHRERKPAAVRVCVPTLTAFRRQTGLSQQYLMRVMRNRMQDILEQRNPNVLI